MYIQFQKHILPQKNFAHALPFKRPFAKRFIQKQHKINQNLYRSVVPSGEIRLSNNCNQCHHINPDNRAPILQYLILLFIFNFTPHTQHPPIATPHI